MRMKKILIADDSRVQVHQISQWLTEKGFHVVASFDALQAWMTALREAPDAIILGAREFLHKPVDRDQLLGGLTRLPE